MFKKIGIILFFVGATLVVAHCLLSGLAFAAVTDDTLCLQCPAEEYLTIETWYPSPYNEYEELRLYPKFNSEESQCVSDDQLGLIYYNKDDQALKVCWKSPINGLYSWEKIVLGQGGYWQLSGNDISNTNSGKVTINTTDSNKVSLQASGAVRIGNYATSSRPGCSSTILGALIYDTTEKRPYVCALNASNSPVWKPLDSDYDRDGITDAVDANDNDFNDATAVEANVVTGKTFYARGGSRKTGTFVDDNIKGVCAYNILWSYTECSCPAFGWCNLYNNQYASGEAYLNSACASNLRHRDYPLCACNSPYKLVQVGIVGTGNGWNYVVFECRKN